MPSHLLDLRALTYPPHPLFNALDLVILICVGSKQYTILLLEI